MWAHSAGLIVLRDRESPGPAAAAACQSAAMVRVVSDPTVCVSAEPIRFGEREVPRLRKPVRSYNQKPHNVTSYVKILRHTMALNAIIDHMDKEFETEKKRRLIGFAK